MTVTSLYFFVFIAIGCIIYYLVPKKSQWVLLLLLSISFYCLAADPVTIVYIAGAALISYAAGVLTESFKDHRKKAKIVAYSSCAAILACWFVFRCSSVWLIVSKIISSLIPAIPRLEDPGLIGALGMGFYSLQAVAYISDVYNAKIRAQRNVLKLVLFIIFFPLLTVGPISRYETLESLYQPHDFSYTNLTFGAQRILWGLFKKLVISDRIAVMTDGIWGAEGALHSGIWIWIAILLYTMQLYTDFSGCIDIVLGTGEIFDIRLQENFKSPFRSQSIKELWQRWHISLSSWLRDYIYIPLGGNRKGTGRKYVNLIIAFLVSGLWHGSIQHMLFFGLYLGIIMVMSEILRPVFDRIRAALSIDRDTLGWRIFCSIRTYVLYSVSLMCFSAKGFSDALFRFKCMIKPPTHINPWTLFDGTVLNCGVSFTDINVMILGVALILTVDNLIEKHGDIRLLIKKQWVVFRWILWLALLTIVVILGHYGPEYNAAEFIYQGF